MSRRVNRRTAPAILTVLAALFLGSAALRFVDIVGAAVAREPAEVSLPGTPATDLNAVITALNERAERLDRREAALADRMQAVTLAEARLSERLAELRAAEAALAATIALADQAAERDLAHLTGLYEAMKPKDAAQLFEEMAPEFAAGFLARMQTEAAAAVLAGMSPRSAYSVSVILAGRNVGVPRD